MFYKDPVASKTIQNHIFTFGSDSNKTTYTRQVYRDADKTSNDLRPSVRAKTGKISDEERDLKVKRLYNNLLIFPPPSLSAIKESDLHNKVAKNVVPEPFKKAYPAPSKAAKDQEKKRKSTKGKNSALKKKATAEHILNYNRERKMKNASPDEYVNQGSLAGNTNDNIESRV